jgi:hypothetical protein
VSQRILPTTRQRSRQRGRPQTDVSHYRDGNVPPRATTCRIMRRQRHTFYNESATQTAADPCLPRQIIKIRLTSLCKPLSGWICQSLAHRFIA